MLKTLKLPSVFSEHGAKEFSSLGVTLCSWAKDSTVTVPLSTQLYKWVPAN